MPAECSSEGGVFSDLYGRLLQEFAAQIGEKASSYGQAARSVREEIVRCVWFGGHFNAERLITDEGRRLEVLSPGWWNVEGGPDFVRAELLMEGAGRLVGDVEVHTTSSAWYAHGHHLQPEYNDVVLHVVMWNDREEPTVRSGSGRAIPQLTLSKAVDEDLEELVEVVDPEAEPAERKWQAVEGKYCSRAVRSGELEPEWLGRLLDLAGDHRILTRAASVAELFENHPREQLLYERLAEALGYKNNRMPFIQLAGLLPMGEMRRAIPVEVDAEEKSKRLEAAFFAVAGFLEAGPTTGAEAETSAYCEGLRQAWAGLQGQLTSVRLSADHWQFAGTRPVNYPPRRIAALAVLCAAHLHTGLFNHFLRLVSTARPQGRQRADVAVRNALAGTFLHLEHPYWSWRYGFGGKKLNRPKALVGQERAMSIVVDVLLPMLLAHAQAESDTALMRSLHALWRGLARRQENAVTRRMEQTMFESKAEAARAVNSARRQQGLHQLYKDCCRAAPPDAGCERCIIYLARHAGKSLAFL
jgi:hypothetical protein